MPEDPDLLDLDLDLNLNLALDIDMDDGVGIDPDPLAGVNYSHGMEAASLEEMQALTQAAKRAANPDAVRQFDKQKRQMLERNDSEYWVAVCFQSRAQKEEFLRHAGVAADDGDKYIDGQMLARKLSIPLTKSPFEAQTVKIDTKLANIARKKGE